MKTVFFLIILFLILLCTFIGFPEFIRSVESNEEDNNNRENFKLRDKISSENKIEDSENSNFYEKGTICKNSIKKYEDLVKIVDNYMQRYVSLFLITSNLREYKIKDPNEMISIDLEISITGDDLVYLQNYSKNHLRNFSKLDDIFSKIARLKERSLVENALKSSKSFFSSLNYYNIVSSRGFYQFLSVLITLLITWLLHHYLFHKSFYIFLILTINGMIFWESLIEYWKRIKEADIEIFVKNLKGIPKECNPENLRWYHSVRNYFSGDPCLQYHKNLNKNPADDVSLFKCIIDTYSFYLIRTPIKIYGASIRDLTEEISALWPQSFRYFIDLTYAPFFAILIAVFILVLLRNKLKLSFFGAALELGGAQRIAGNDGPFLTSSDTPKTVRVIRKLRPWTKSRFPKRIENSVGKKKKLFLKSSRPESELSSEDEQKNTESFDKLINNEVNHD